MFTIYVWVSCQHVCTTFLSDACGGQKKAFLETVGPLRLELRVIVSHHAGSGTSLWYAFYKIRSIRAFAYAQDCNVILTHCSLLISYVCSLEACIFPRQTVVCSYLTPTKRIVSLHKSGCFGLGILLLLLCFSPYSLKPTKFAFSGLSPTTTHFHLLPVFILYKIKLGLTIPALLP